MMKNTLCGGKATALAIKEARGIHMLGIGGVGMSSLAVIAKARGLLVFGEDRAESETVRMLRAEGIEVSARHTGIDDRCDALIYSAAISETHPAFLEARAKGIPVFSRSDFLAAMMESYPRRVTIAGVHGKSTVTAMLDRILLHAGLSPTTVSGATLFGGSTYRIGEGDVFIAEACEYTDSFLSLSPTIAVALNLEHDHPDYFQDEGAMMASFARYLAKAEAGVVLPTSGPLLSLAPRSRSVHTFGEGGTLSAKITSRHENGTDFALFNEGKAWGSVRLPLIGDYQVDNALAAILTAKLLGVPLDVCAEALSDFKSPDRRCKLRLCLDGVRYIDDYAHHPSAIKAVLSAIRPVCRGRLICAFEAHTYSRLAAFFDQYVEALSLADHVVVLPIYPAREADSLGQSERRVADALLVPSVFFTDLLSAARYLKESTAEGDTVAVLGAGNTPILFDFLEN